MISTTTSTTITLEKAFLNLGDIIGDSTSTYVKKESLIKQTQKSIALFALAISVNTSGFVYTLPTVSSLSDSNNLFQKDSHLNQGKRRLALLKQSYFNPTTRSLRIAKASQALASIRPFDGIDQDSWNDILESDYLS